MRPHAGDGGGGQQADGQPGPDPRRREGRVVTRFRNTLGLPGTLACACSPTIRPTIRKGIAASIIDGLMYGCGDAVIGINPATDSPAACASCCA
jgi:ethanolamine ammonia-lyase large subunit